MPAAEHSASEALEAPRAASDALRALAETAALGLLLLAALVPTIRLGAITILGVRVLTPDLALVLLVPFCALLLWPRWRPATPWWPLLVAMGATLVYGGISTAQWSGLHLREGLGDQLFVLACSGAAMAVACLLVGAQDGPGLVRLIDRLTLAMAAVATAYVLKSWYAAALGLDFIRLQEQRTGGPLASPAVLHFPILPALAWAAGRALVERGRQRWLWLAVAAAVAFAILSTRSRGALLGAGVFALLGALRLPDRRLRLRLVASVLLVGAAAEVAVLSQSSADRLTAFADTTRSLNLDAVLRAWSWDAWTTVRGWGLGHFWNWYPTDVTSIITGPSIYEYGFLYIETQFGVMLYHPHSLVLFLVTELGLVGAGFLLVLGGSLLWAVLRARDAGQGLLAAGLLGSTTALVADLLVFKSFIASGVWWVFLFACLRLAAAPSTPSPRNGEPAPCAS